MISHTTSTSPSETVIYYDCNNCISFANVEVNYNADTDKGRELLRVWVRVGRLVWRVGRSRERRCARVAERGDGEGVSEDYWGVLRRVARMEGFFVIFGISTTII